jgi:predicted DCC family thiol-disulfide oxidoreductase YuxK
MSLGPILFYDGECGLCARAVQWVLRRDAHGLFRFAPLQGSTYASLNRERPTDCSTMVLLDGDDLLTESDAAIRIARRVGGPWGAMAAIGAIVPRSLRNALYRAVARRRHRWFGHADACRLATAEERGRFLP